VSAKGLEKVAAISAGAEHTCALLEENTLRCWGENHQGQLGLGSRGEPVSTPTPVQDLQAILSVSAGDHHTCALAANGVVWCWGKNAQGQLGLGSTEDRSQPSRVDDLKDVTSLSAGSAHTCALTRTGRVYCWGDNSAGQTGQDSEAAILRPMAVPGLPPVVSISAGGGQEGSHTCAVTKDGQVFCWGDNSAGQLGREASSGRAPLPQLVKGLGAARQVAAGSRHSCSLNPEGAMHCWGNNSGGQLGDGSGANHPSPRQVP